MAFLRKVCERIEPFRAELMTKQRVMKFTAPYSAIKKHKHCEKVRNEWAGPMAEDSEKQFLDLAGTGLTRSSSCHCLVSPRSDASLSRMSQPALQHSLMRALHIYNEFCINQIVTEDQQSRTTLYHINNQLTFLSDRPDVIVHRDDSSPVGFCRLKHCFLSSCKLECYVDEACSQLLTVVQRTNFSGTFAFELLRSDGVPRYKWENTTLLGMGRSYELMDEQGRVFAFFDNATFSMSKCGTLYVQSDLNECFLDIIILTLAILLEARRREAGSKHRC